MFSILLVLLSVISRSSTKTYITYTFGIDCHVSLKYIDESTTVYVEYNGDEVDDIFCDDMSFIGRDEDILNEYELCVTPIYYDDPECSLRMKYTENYDGHTLQKFTCTHKPSSKFCGGQDEYLYIFLNTLNDQYHQAKFTLKIEAIKVFDYDQRVGAIVGGVFGGLAFLGIMCCFCYCCSNKNTQGQALNPSSVPGIQQSQPLYPNSGGYPSQTGGHVQPQTIANYPTYTTGGYSSQPTEHYPLQTTDNSTTQPNERSSHTPHANEGLLSHQPTSHSDYTIPCAPPPSYDEVQSWSYNN